MKKIPEILIVGIILLIGSCGSNKGANPEFNLLIGTWEYSDTSCPQYSKIGQTDGRFGVELTFVEDGTGVLNLFGDLPVVMYATIKWRIEDNQIVCTFLDKNFNSEYSLEELSNMHSGPFNVSDSSFTLFESELNSSCWSNWNRHH